MQNTSYFLAWNDSLEISALFLSNYMRTLLRKKESVGGVD